MPAAIRLIPAASAAALVAFAAVTLLVSNDLTDTIDRTIMLSMRDAARQENPWGPTWFTETAVEITALGGYPIIVATVLIVTCVLLILRLKAAAMVLTGTIISGSIVSTVLKQIFDRPRPDIVEHLDRVYTSSFPSAHAMVSTVAWLTLAVIAIRFVQLRLLQVFIFCTAASIALLVGTSRVYLGVHWPTDVLAGWCAGVFWTGICWTIANRYLHKFKP